MSEIDHNRVGSILSGIPTVVKADKTRWALADHSHRLRTISFSLFGNTSKV